MSKILCTGASGFIGSHLVKALEKRGDYVHTIRGADLSYMNDTPPKDVDYIFHLSAFGNMAYQKDDAKIFVANLQGTYCLLSMTKDIPYKAFINVSSSSVLLPHQTMYSATKLGAEALCKAFVDEYDKPIVTVRPYSVYGPGEADFRFIPTVFRSCLKGEPMDLAPEPIHDWVYVDDFVKAMIDTAQFIDVNAYGDKTGLKGKIIPVGTGVGTSNKAIVKMIEEITGKKATIRSTKTMRKFDNKDWVCDISLLNMTTIYEGLQKYYESIEGNMAYDVTALTTAIAEGKIDESAARQLISEASDLEIKIAKLLNPPVQEQTPEQPANDPGAGA